MWKHDIYVSCLLLFYLLWLIEIRGVILSTLKDRDPGRLWVAHLGAIAPGRSIILLSCWFLADGMLGAICTDKQMGTNVQRIKMKLDITFKAFFKKKPLKEPPTRLCDKVRYFGCGLTWQVNRQENCGLEWCALLWWSFNGTYMYVIKREFGTWLFYAR